MALVTDGILTQKLPWGLVLLGVFITHRHRADGRAIAAGRRRRVPPDLDVVGDVRGRRWSAGWSSVTHADAEPVDRRNRVRPGRALLERADRGRRNRRHRGGRPGDASSHPRPTTPAYLQPTTSRTGPASRRMIGKIVTGGWQDFVALGSSCSWAHCSSASPAGSRPGSHGGRRVTEPLQLGDGAAARPLTAADAPRCSGSSSRTGRTSTSGCAGRRRCGTTRT